MTTLLPRLREDGATVIEDMVSRAISLAQPREPEVVYEGSPGRVAFYRITPRGTYVLLAQLTEEGHYDGEYDTPWPPLEVEECLADLYEEVYS